MTFDLTRGAMEDFTPMRVSFRSAGGASSARVLYCKRHSVRLESPLTPNGRTLFTVGWPAYCSDEDAAQLFSRAGQVTGVFLQVKFHLCARMACLVVQCALLFGLRTRVRFAPIFSNPLAVLLRATLWVGVPPSE